MFFHILSLPIDIFCVFESIFINIFPSSQQLVEPKFNYIHLCSHTFRCEWDINECDPSPCKNGAKCNNQIAKAECVCPEGFTGPLCEEVKVITCQDEPCRNGSICLQKKGESGLLIFNLSTKVC